MRPPVWKNATEYTDVGIQVVAVVALVDREEGGMDAVRAEAGAGIPVSAVFGKSELEAHWQSCKRGVFNRQQDIPRLRIESGVHSAEHLKHAARPRSE